MCDAINVHVLEGAEEVSVSHHALGCLPVDLLGPPHDHNTLTHCLNRLRGLRKGPIAEKEARREGRVERKVGRERRREGGGGERREGGERRKRGREGGGGGGGGGGERRKGRREGRGGGGERRKGGREGGGGGGG